MREPYKPALTEWFAVIEGVFDGVGWQQYQLLLKRLLLHTLLPRQMHCDQHYTFILNVASKRAKSADK